MHGDSRRLCTKAPTEKQPQRKVRPQVPGIGLRPQGFLEKESVDRSRPVRQQRPADRLLTSDGHTTAWQLAADFYPPESHTSVLQQLKARAAGGADVLREWLTAQAAGRREAIGDA